MIVAKGVNRIADDSVQHSVVCGSTNKPSQWIIFEDGQGVGRALSALLEEREHSCTFVLPGQAYEKMNEREFRIDPVSLTDMQRLINEVQCKGLLPLCGAWSALWFNRLLWTQVAPHCRGQKSGSLWGCGMF